MRAIPNMYYVLLQSIEIFGDIFREKFLWPKLSLVLLKSFKTLTRSEERYRKYSVSQTYLNIYFPIEEFLPLLNPNNKINIILKIYVFMLELENSITLCLLSIEGKARSISNVPGSFIICPSRSLQSTKN